MVRVLFVCMGNICRSPMAEGAFRHLAAAAGLLDREDGMMTDSAGTSRHHVGEPPDPRAVRAARARGYDIAHQRARQVAVADFDRFDYLIAMDRDNLAHLERLAPADSAARLGLFLSYAAGVGLDEVPDPYFGGEGGFEGCLGLIEAAAHGLFAHILADHFPDHVARACR
ncbi:MAG: low molecular weight protein-tyrosine-phosphatase [Rhodothalassiaceae bacterium]